MKRIGLTLGAEKHKHGPTPLPADKLGEHILFSARSSAAPADRRTISEGVVGSVSKGTVHHTVMTSEASFIVRKDHTLHCLRRTPSFWEPILSVVNQMLEYPQMHSSRGSDSFRRIILDLSNLTPLTQPSPL
jgi:hypothetical protein